MAGRQATRLAGANHRDGVSLVRRRRRRRASRRSWRDFWTMASHRSYSLLGTAVVADARQFYHQSAAAAKAAGSAGGPARQEPTNPSSRCCRRASWLFDYAPFSQLFPRAAAIVHHGGIGTIGQAMRSGRPSLVMPCAWDQPDNAERAARLGIARTIARNRYDPQRVAAELRLLLEDPAYSQRALKLQRRSGKRTASQRRAMPLNP